MARWEPGARERMVLAAADLFAEQGYDATTVAQIAERAGVTKSTFFRHFPDKRELLVAGDWLAPGAIVMFERGRDEPDPAPAGFEQLDARDYGAARVFFFRLA